MGPHTKKILHFGFSYCFGESNNNVSIPVLLPLSGLLEDHAEAHLRESRIPCFVEDEFRKSFLKFVEEEEDRIYQEEGDKAVTNLDLDQLLNEQEAETCVTTPFSTHSIQQEEEFGQICHKLYHSPVLYAMRAEENRSALELRILVKKRNDELKEIQNHHVMAMEGYVNNGGNVDTAAVNDLAASQISQRQDCEVKWASEISHLMEKQRKEFYAWVLNTYEESLDSKKYTSYIPSTDTYSPESQLEPRLEESFSICIGSQLKITHSIRIFVDSVWNLCAGHPHAPERLQTALSLYTNSLSGLILLVDNSLNLYSGNTHKLSKICEVFPEFHFPTFDQQLTTMRQKLLNPDVIKRRTPTNCLIDDTVPNAVVKEDKSSGDLILPTGTCYLSRHSNLKEVHCVLHLVSTLHELQGDLSSRDPLLIGLKSALKIASENSIDNLIIPLFLTTKLEPNMDHTWCMKRCEIVFKCVKGFMIEVGSTGVTTSKTFHFILPKNTSHKTFQAISNLLPTIFRVPCPMVLDQGSRKKTLTVQELTRLNFSGQCRS